MENTNTTDPIIVIEEPKKVKGFGKKTKIALVAVAVAGLAYYAYDKNKSDDPETTTEDTTE